MLVNKINSSRLVDYCVVDSHKLVHYTLTLTDAVKLSDPLFDVQGAKVVI